MKNEKRQAKENLEYRICTPECKFAEWPEDVCANTGGLICNYDKNKGFIWVKYSPCYWHLKPSKNYKHR
jgi:hypothetical protein